MEGSTSASKLGAPRRVLWWAGSLAAAALLLFVLSKMLAHDKSTLRAQVQVALAPSWESPEEFVEKHPGLVGLKPPGLDVLRGASESTNIDAAAFAAKAHTVEEETASAATRPSLQPITAGYFVVPLRTERPVSIVVFGLPANGASVRFYPESTDPRPIPMQARLEPGSYVLPHERIELIDEPGSRARVVYNRGFLVPIGAGEMTVLIATRETLLDAQTLKTIDDAIAHKDAREAIESLLAARNFEVSALKVIEPKD